MFNVAIVDDEMLELKLTEQVLNNWCSKRKQEIKIFSFDNSEKFINFCMIEGELIQVVFLDIQMEPVNGIEIAKKLNRLNRECLVIFTTNYCDYIFNGYKGRGFRYILKKNLSNALEEAMDAALLELTDSDTYFMYSSQKKLKRVLCKDILYFESDKRLINIYLNEDKQVQSFYGQISKIEQNLNCEVFIRCHQSYIVNQRYITGIEDNGIQVKDNVIRIPISDRYKKMVEQSLLWSV
jgi:two-component system, LytTR family, response regulator LytT